VSFYVPTLGRAMSQSEVSTLLACPAKWAFAYSDFAGFPIQPRVTALRLREGRAWGAGIQQFHTRTTPDLGIEDACGRAAAAMLASLDEDAAQMEREGAFDPEEYDVTKEKLIGALVHYASTSERLNLVGSEVELELHHGDGWVYRCHLDGIHQDEDGYLWIVEFKLRGAGAFTPLEQVVLWRQVRWYAIALENSGLPETERFRWMPEAYVDGLVRGVIVDERLNDAPSPVRFNKDGAVSATQSCTLEQYLDACAVRGQIPHEPTIARLSAKVWSQRHTVLFRVDELVDALHELEAAAGLVAIYAGHSLRPIRNPGRQCGYCEFAEICATPTDARLRDSLYRPAEGTPA
jgi:PD-(D/E)XK nuclease superfamily